MSNNVTDTTEVKNKFLKIQDTKHYIIVEQELFY